MAVLSRVSDVGRAAQSSVRGRTHLSGVQPSHHGVERQTVRRALVVSCKGAPELLADGSSDPHHVRTVAVNAVSSERSHRGVDRTARLTSGRAALQPSLEEAT